MGFNSAHLKAFKRSVDAKLCLNEWDTKTARDFAKGVMGTEPPTLLDDEQNRSTLKKLVAKIDADTETVCLAILAWGGMHRGNRDRLYRNGNNAWLSVAEDMRAGKLNRVASYEAFKELRADKNLKGMGPAFYTKLIHFLLPRDAEGEPQAYIMDQWAGCSINLLVGGVPVVLMNCSFHYNRTKAGLKQSSNFIVSDANTGEDYERFCSTVEKLKAHFNKSGDEIDRALMSNGGKIKSPWRAYVIEHREP